MTDSRPTLSTRERTRLFTLHGGTCHICGGKIDGSREAWEVEHIIPRAMFLDRREADTDENMKPAHLKCHRAKSAVDIPAIAKAKRLEAKRLGFKKSSKPLPCGRNSPWKKTFNRGTVPRHPKEAP